MPDYKRIATEEAWATRDQIKLFRKLLADGYDDPGYRSLWGFYLNSTSDRARFIIDRLQDLGPNRIAEMDASGIDMQVLMLTSPGVQVFDAATAEFAGRRQQRRTRRRHPQVSDPLHRPRRRRAAGPAGGREGNRPRGAPSSASRA